MKDRSENVLLIDWPFVIKAARQTARLHADIYPSRDLGCVSFGGFLKGATELLRLEEGRYDVALFYEEPFEAAHFDMDTGRAFSCRTIGGGTGAFRLLSKAATSVEEEILRAASAYGKQGLTALVGDDDAYAERLRAWGEESPVDRLLRLGRDETAMTGLSTPFQKVAYPIGIGLGLSRGEL